MLLLVVKLVFPKFVALYEQMDLEFPAISKAVFLGVEIINHPITLLLTVLSIVACAVFRRQIQQRLFNFFLWLPFTRSIVGKILCASLCETLAYLHKDGVPVLRALQMIAATPPFDVHRSKLENAKKILTSTAALARLWRA